MALWYLSFASMTEFLGATVVAADDVDGAWIEATTRGLNPGGEVVIFRVPEHLHDEPDIQLGLNRLMRRDELLARGAKRLKSCPQEIQDAWDEHADAVVCEKHNKRH